MNMEKIPSNTQFERSIRDYIKMKQQRLPFVIDIKFNIDQKEIPLNRVRQILYEQLRTVL